MPAFASRKRKALRFRVVSCSPLLQSTHPLFRQTSHLPFPSAAMPPAGSLTDEQLRFFDANGYLVLGSFSSAEEVKAMRDRMAELVDGFDGAGDVFSTKDHRQVKNDFFFKSAENISFFFEEKAFGDDGCLKQAKELSINKVGHALHELDPVFKKFSFGANVSSLFSSLRYKRPAVIQSMYIFKQPGIGGEVVPHQDNTFLYTDPPSCTGLWLALEDATKTNGCLWAIPGSHKNGLKRRMIRDEIDTHFDHPSPTYDLKEFVPLEVKSGDLVVIHGDLIHQSFENLSPVSRHALSLHVIDTEGCEWSKQNWLQRKIPPQPLYEN
uniref:Phytanoyl-CoA dioxygenase n=1 Tax=Oryza meridionalis TaxID=40149 RepID=A0A0E0D5G4_9ORYZ